MTNDDLQLIKSNLEDADTLAENKNWAEAKAAYLKVLEDFDRIAAADPEASFTDEELTLKKKAQDQITIADAKLAQLHREQGIVALEAKDYARAVDELEEAINLAAETEVTFLEEVKSFLDKARILLRDQEIFTQISPSVKQGDDLRHAGAYAEAILEYQEALKSLGGMPENHRFVTYVKQSLRECKRALVRSYMRRSQRSADLGKYLRAYKVLQRAQLVVADDDFTYRAFLLQIGERLASHLKPTDIDEASDIEAPEKWATAIKDYEEALTLYQSSSRTDPFSPAFSRQNMYEDRFLSARRQLATLYRERGDKLRDKAEIEKALKNYKEALKLYPRADKEFHATFSEIRKLRAQIGNPAPDAQTH
ncbi:MAG TPA: hypothetical protein PKO06_04225 [Candidatus Ozemobacteraceae bacterium]|nr:hypothetical protein [Candidatus Ozemobacteraceae bacterium]